MDQDSGAVTNTAGSGRFNISEIIPLAIIVLVMGALYVGVPYSSGYWGGLRSVGAWVYDAWNHSNGDWAHGMLVLPLCIFMIYQKWGEIRKVTKVGENWGLLLVLLGLALYWVGYRADNTYFSYGAAHLLLAGMVIWFYGAPLFRVIIFPWLFLVFMWPMPFLDSLIAFPLRILMSKLSYYTFNIIGLSCVQVGTAVLSASDPAHGLREGQRFAVDVADPCSGIRSLFALSMVTALYGYFVLPKAWQKLVLFLFSAPLAILGNWLRILMLTLGSLYLGSDVAIGTIDQPSTFHMAAGFVVFAGALVGMLGVSYILEKIGGSSGRPEPAP